MGREFVPVYKRYTLTRACSESDLELWKETATDFSCSRCGEKWSPGETTYYDSDSGDAYCLTCYVVYFKADSSFFDVKVFFSNNMEEMD